MVKGTALAALVTATVVVACGARSRRETPAAGHSDGGTAGRVVLAGGGAGARTSGGAAGTAAGGADAGSGAGGSPDGGTPGDAGFPGSGGGSGNGTTGQGGDSWTEAGAGPGDAGAGGAHDDLDCSLVVPRDEATIQAAVDRAPSPGVVCVESGRFDGEVTLRDGVGLRGNGASTLCGDIKLSAPTRGVTIEQLMLGGTLHVASPSRLEIRELSRPTGGAPCDSTSDEAVVVDLSNGGALELDIERSALEPTGVAIQATTAPAGPVALDVTVRNSRCSGLDNQCYDFLSFDADLPQGSRAQLFLENNALSNVVLEAIGGHLGLYPEDAARSQLTLVHNTFFAVDEPNAAIYFWNDPLLPIRAQANAFASFSHVIRLGSQDADPTEYDQGGNVFAFGVDGPPSPLWYSDWFEDAWFGDLDPLSGSPLFNAAGPNDTGTDANGRSRVGRSDAGAFQFVPDDG